MCHKDYLVRTLWQCFGLLLPNVHSIEIFVKASAHTELEFSDGLAVSCYIQGSNLTTSIMKTDLCASLTPISSDLTPVTKPLSKDAIQMLKKSNCDPYVGAQVRYLKFIKNSFRPFPHEILLTRLSEGILAQQAATIPTQCFFSSE